jgi:pyruvate/2-oxoglutarate dehydrogenase complex dihydrolipoamide dehydrogenase (E3) component
VFVNVGTHATIPDTPGLREAGPMMRIEALDLQRRPGHLIVIGGGYVGLELGQSLRRLGSRVTLISRDSQLASNEDADVGQAFLRLFRDEDIDVPLNSRVLGVDGRSGGHEPWTEPIFSLRLGARPTRPASDLRKRGSRSRKRDTSG